MTHIKAFTLTDSDFCEVRQCPLCASVDRGILRKQNDTSIYRSIYPNYVLDLPKSVARRHLLRCNNCGLVYWDLIPQLQSLPSYETEIQDYKFDESRALGKKAKLMAQFLHQDSTLVDIGASHGELLREIRKRNQSATLLGVEPSLAVNHEGENIKIIKALFNSKLPLKEKSVDVFTAIDVFEHMPQLSDIFITVSLFLKDGGVIYIESPNGNYLYNKVIGFNNINLFWIEHLSFLTRKSLDYICNNFGFELALAEKIQHVETDIFRRYKSMIKGLVLAKGFRIDRPMYISSRDHLKIILRKRVLS